MTLFNSYYIEMLGKALLLSSGCSTLSWIQTLKCSLLSKAASSTNFGGLWFDSTWDWTSVSKAIHEHSTLAANGPTQEIRIQSQVILKTKKIWNKMGFVNTSSWMHRMNDNKMQREEKKLIWNYTRMLRAILNKSWK